MNTKFLGDDEVDAYLRDFADRLLQMSKMRPTVWVLIGPSGRELAKRLVHVKPELETSATAVPIEYDRDSERVSVSNGGRSQIAGKRVLVLDSSIHSGFTFQKAIAAIYAWGARDVCSYSLVVKQSSAFVPSFWGVTIGDHDRAYFLLSELPNNHFHDNFCLRGQVRERPVSRALPEKRSPFFHLRRLCSSDMEKNRVKSGTPSLDRVNWADRYYEMRSNPDRLTYVLETGNRITGYATIDRNETELHIEAIAVDVKAQGKGYGAALLRWAETFARQSDLRRIYLWGIDKHVPMYEKYKYRKVDNQQICLDDGTYFLMTKPVLSHLI